MVTNMEERKSWDNERLHGMEATNETDKNKWYFIGKKPPIPNVVTRDYLIQCYKDLDDIFGDGKKVFLWHSIDDKEWNDVLAQRNAEKKNSQNKEQPVKEEPAIVRMLVEVIATVVEKNPEAEGKGCLVTDYRSVDMNGEMLEMAIEKGSKMGPKMSYDVWVKAVADGYAKKKE